MPTADTVDALQRDLFAPDAEAGSQDDRSTTTSTGTVAVLFRCRPCERTTGRPHLWRETFSRSIIRRTHQHPSLGRPVTQAETTWSLPDGRTLRGEHAPARQCRSCQRPTSGQPIRGRFSAAHRCDARCIYAKGPDCECSCAGANHGIGHNR